MPGGAADPSGVTHMLIKPQTEGANFEKSPVDEILTKNGKFQV